MSNNFGLDIDFYADKPHECTDLLARYLNKGHLSLLLGAGASSGFGLPKWDDLVLSVAKVEIPGDLDPTKAKYSGSELKELTQKFKRKINDENLYHKIVKEHLYDGVTFDYTIAKKELLTAISALIVGKRRGNVQQIFTFNFDGVLEWYLKTLGLSVNTIVTKHSFAKAADVNITHIHGYLPHKDLKEDDSEFIIFSQNEFIDRLLSATDYWKQTFYEFFRKNVFLSIGLSVDSVINDVCPYLRQMDEWYEFNKLNRLYPYGVALFSPGTTEKDYFPELIEHGVIPCVLPTHDDVPLNIFRILQQAAILAG